MWLKDDLKRYRWLITLHTICTIFFIIRFIVLCTDLSSAKSDSIAFPVVILLLELASSVLIFIANLTYVFLRYIGPILFESEREKVGCCSQGLLWNFATLTCFRCECYFEYPQIVSVVRFLILTLFELLRFIAFILSCVCANRYSPIGLGYSILAGFTLVPALILLLVEYLHYYRVWFHYQPDGLPESTAEEKKKHIRFLPLTVANDQQTSHWQDSRCPRGNSCRSRNLYHVIMYHSGNTKYKPDSNLENETIVGFHQTSHEAAFSIAKSGLKGSEDGWIGPGIYFATSLDHTQFKANKFGAYICAVIHLGKIERIKNPKEWKNVQNADTIYLEHPLGADEFRIKDDSQIRSWIILVDQEPNIDLLEEKNIKKPFIDKYFLDSIEDKVYKGCLFNV